MDSNVGYAHLGLEAVRLGNVAVAGVDHERRTKLARVDDALHFRVAAVIAAHEADLKQTLAMSSLGCDDLLAVACVLCERLFAENEFACLQRLEHVACVARVGRGDDDSLYLGGVDELLAGLIGLHALVLCSNLVCGFFEVVCAGNDLAARNDVGQTTDMVAADGAAADHTNVQHSVFSFWIVL